jgi:type II secretory pathway pseudopilin PulG
VTSDFDPFASPAPEGDAETLLRKGIEDARAGDRLAARTKFERVVELDDHSEKGWFWLASVVDTDLERRAALEKVLELNPNNDRARRALDALEARMEMAAAAPVPAARAAADEVIPGVSRRTLYALIGLGAAIILVFIALVVVLIVVNSNNQAAAAAERLANDLATISAQTQVAQDATQAAQDAAATQFAIATPTSMRPTLPPEWTATPPPTPEPTIAMLPPPQGVTGVLAAWGGRDLENIGFLPVGIFNLNAGTQFERVGDEIGRNVTVYPNGQRIAYTVYDRVFFATNLQAVNTNGANVENFGERFNSAEIINPEMPAYSADGTSLVFVAQTPDNASARQVFMLSLVNYTLTRLTSDALDYTYPRLSPDGRRVVVVRNDNAAGQGVDLALIDVATTSKFALTNDQNALVETQPHWSPDGTQVIYSAALATDPRNHDIYLRNGDGTGAAFPLVQSDEDELFPVLSPDTRYLAYAGNRSGNYEIYILDLQRQALAQLTNDPASSFFPGDWWGP